MLSTRVGVLWCVLAAGCAAEGPDGEVATTQQELAGGSSEASYLVPLADGVSFEPLISVGDTASNGYAMVGIPDGLGAWRKGQEIHVLMNHELGPTQGAVRAHGATGAFVSAWTIDKKTHEVIEGHDLIEWAVLWNATAAAYDPPVKGYQFQRFCSANLPDRSAFWGGDEGVPEGEEDDGALGYKGRIYMNGEEISTGGRAFAHVVDTGISYELPRLGKAQFENQVARPHSGERTVVAGADDTTVPGGEVTIYVGTKTASGSPVDRAGLTNGTLLTVVVDGYPLEPAGGIPSGTHVSMYDAGDVSALSFTQLQALQTANGGTFFARPEDISWNPANPDELYFATTASFTGSTRLWRITFVDGSDPAAGGVIDLLIDGNTVPPIGGDHPHMFDNMTVTNDGHWVYLQEDPGNVAYTAKVWRFDLETEALELLAEHDPARFVDPLAPGFLTRDEESSGIMDAQHVFGPGTLLLDVQVHRPNPTPGLVEYGQLTVMTVD
jgi:hypothetical protein